MIPVICKIGPIPIYSFGLMLASAVLICSYLLKRDSYNKNINPDLITDLIFWGVIGGIIGARLFFIFANFSYFVLNPLEIVMLQKGGLSWQGSIIFGAVVLIVFIKVNKLKILEVLDVVAPYIALGQAIGRIGCFLNGCCYGRHWDLGIYFPLHLDRLHPTQLYSSFGLLTIFFVLKKFRKTQTVQGVVFFTYLLLASGLRFVIEFFRADHEMFFWNLSIYQVICLMFILIGVYANILLKSKSRKK